MASRSANSSRSLAGVLAGFSGAWAFPMVLLFCALTIVGASIKVPLPGTPVPLSLQSVAVVMSGIVLGARLGLESQLLYLLIGAAGVPVFTNGGGLEYFTSPTAGYLIGFAVAAYASGFVAERFKGAARVFGSAAAGFIAIFVCGLTWLAISTGSIERAIEVGLMPFVAGLIIKFGIVCSMTFGLTSLQGNASTASES